MSMSATAPEPETLRIARAYLAHGWSVVPVRPREKLPAVAWAKYQHVPATHAQLDDWFSSGGYGIGLVQGATADTIVLDFDGEEGHATRRALEIANGPFPHTVEALTPGGGCHVVLRHPGRPVPTRKGLFPGFDVRGDGGFIVAHPSIHPSGRRYEWDCDCHPDDTAVAECPAWVADIICGELEAGHDTAEAIVHAMRPGPMGLPEAVITDGREAYMRDTILAVLREMTGENDRLPDAADLFARVWPQYSRKVDLSRPGRGSEECMAKCRYTLKRIRSGALPGFERFRETRHNYETGEGHEEPEAEATPPPSPATDLPASPFDPAEMLAIEPRKWVYGHFLIRRYLSVIGAPGGTGKSAYIMGVGMAVALGEALLAERVHESGAVWIYNLEDPRDEILRRIHALCIQHNVDPARLVGRLYVDSGRDRPLIVAEKTADGRVVQMPIVDALVAELKARNIKLLIVDPFVKSHRLEENRNEQIDFAASLWNRVAELADCAIALLHHFRKGGQSGDADAFRGAAALTDAARAAVSLAHMSEKEAEKLGIDLDERRFFVRVDNAKLNLAPPPKDAVWINLKSVDLPNGDKVQAVVRWEPPSPWHGLSIPMVVKILDELVRGINGELYQDDYHAKDNWAGSIVMEIGKKTSSQARTIIETWVKEGLLTVKEFINHARKKRNGCDVNLTKLAELRSQIRGDEDE